MTTLLLPPGTTRETVIVLDEIARERIHQVKTQATPADDDEKYSGEWFDLLALRCSIETDFRTKPEYRRQMIELATVAIAIVETIDRHAEIHGKPA